mgnify:CR=1 FL=1
MNRRGALALGTLLTACHPSAAPPAPEPRDGPPPTAPVEAGPVPRPLLPPQDAFRRGWMPIQTTGVPEFLALHPTYDGQGVLIAILDSGLDPGIPGLETTTRGARKLLDLRDFSGEGRIRLTPLETAGDQARVAGHPLRGLSRVRALASGRNLYGGALIERELGVLPASDLNGNGNELDTLPVVVARASDGWVLFADTDGDRSLANEKPVHDFLVARESFGWRTRGRPAPLNLAANFQERDGRPELDLFFDTSAHGSHVAGIAAGHDLYGVKGFNGVAPGAYLLGLKIANNAHGGISTTGSMLAAIGYAVRFARDRALPLVLNLSFGVGNEAEGKARIDAAIDSVLQLNPDVVFVVSAGNDGPGLSTMGFPGSADRVMTVGATFPAVFLGGGMAATGPVACFSSRGGELAKPDVVAPGLAYSTVPRWDTGAEWKGGTSMAAPHAAGLTALLASGLRQAGDSLNARRIRQALMVTARPVAGASYLDAGTGQPDVGAAWRWLRVAPRLPELRVRALRHGVTAQLQAVDEGTLPDTLADFEITAPADAAPLAVTLRTDVSWIRAPASLRLGPGSTRVRLAYAAADLRRPGVYTGMVTAWTSDSVLGPVFRLVGSVIVLDTGSTIIRDLGRLPPGGESRVFFRVSANRPLLVGAVSSEGSETVQAWLHEPGGQHFRGEPHDRSCYADDGLVQADAADLIPGVYQAVAVAPPVEGAPVTMAVLQSPVTLTAQREQEDVAVSLANLTDQTVEGRVTLLRVGSEQRARVTVSGSDRMATRFALPAWAVHAVLDVQLPAERWPEVTDFGVTVFDRAGRQLGKSPLDYAFGRLHLDLGPRAPGDTLVEVVLFPGFAEAAHAGGWEAALTFRAYTDSARVTATESRPIRVGPRLSLTTRVPWPDFAGTDPDQTPLAIVALTEREHTWTHELPLLLPATAFTQ